jgi:hypothetical protein
VQGENTAQQLAELELLLAAFPEAEAVASAGAPAVAVWLGGGLMRLRLAFPAAYPRMGPLALSL